MVKILKLKVRQDWAVFCWRCLVEVMKFYLGRDSEASFGQDFEI